MNERMKSQRGEGKVGCSISLLVLIIVGGISLKAVPAYYADNQIIDLVQRKIEQAAGRTSEDLEKEIRIEIRQQSIDVPEAVAPSAIKIRKTLVDNAGNVKAFVKYSHKIDFYGITDYTIIVDKQLEMPLLENIK